MRVEILDNLIIVDAWVNGSGPLLAILDTGSSVSVVAPSVARRAGLASAATTQSRGMGKGLDQTVGLAPHARLEWGTAECRQKLDDRTVALLPLDYIFHQTGVRAKAILGADAHAAQVIEIDYMRQTVKVGPDQLLRPGACRVPVRFVSGIPFVEAGLTGPNGERVEGLFKIDSGSTGALILSPHFLDDHPCLTEGLQPISIPSVQAVGGTVDLGVARFDALELGDFQLASPVAAIPAHAAGSLARSGVAGIIGADVLRRFVVVWNYPEASLCLTPNAAFSERFEADASGLRLRCDQSGIVVVNVMNGSPAARAGMQASDILLSIDDEHLPLWSVKRRLCRVGDTTELRVRRGRTDFTARMKLERLV